MSAPPPSYDQATGPQGGYTNPGGYGAQQAPYPPQAGYPQQGGYPPNPNVPPPQQGGHPPQGYNTEYGYNQPSQQAPKNENYTAVDIDNANFGSTFDDKNIRRAFIRKVYMILTAQLFVTVLFICVCMFAKPVKDFIQGSAGMPLYYTSYAVFIVTYIVLICCPGVRRKTPGNYICLSVFTLAFSFMTGMITSFYDTEIVLIAAAITCVVCASVMIFAMQTKFDFTMCGGLLFVGCMVVFFFGLACMIVSLTVGYSRILNCVYAGIAALLFCLFLAFDTQMLLGGKKYQLSEEEYIFGALQLYLDIVYIFLMILSLAGSSK